MANKKVTTTTVEETVSVEPTPVMPTPAVDTTVPQTTTVTKVASKDNTAMVVLLVIFIFLLILGLAYLFAGDQITSTINTILNTKSNVPEDTDTDTDEDIVAGDITVTSPKAGDSVDGMFLVEGTIPNGYGYVTVNLYDDDDAEEILGTGAMSEERGNFADDEYWTEYAASSAFGALVSVDKSPSTDNGYIIVEAANADRSKTKSVKVAVTFLTLTGKDNGGNEQVKVFAPLQEQTLVQTLDGYEIYVGGMMKDFFEGNMTIKLINDKGVEMFENFVQAEGDNMGQYVDFGKTITGSYDEDEVGSAGKTGKLQFIETSAKDGSEDVVLEVPIIFEFTAE